MCVGWGAFSRPPTRGHVCGVRGRERGGGGAGGHIKSGGGGGCIVHSAYPLTHWAVASGQWGEGEKGSGGSRDKRGEGW